MYEKEGRCMPEFRQKILSAVDELRPLLPVSDAILEQQDRASILRIAYAYFRISEYFKMNVPRDTERLPIGFNTLCTQATEGFYMVLDQEYRIIYVSEGISTHLGYSQIQMYGTFVFEYIHPQDVSVLNGISETLLINPGDAVILETPQLFTIRMHTRLPKRNAGFSQNGFKTVICNGFFREITYDGKTRKSGLLMYCQLVDKVACTEVLLTPDMFLVRCTPELRMVFVETRIGGLLGYKPSGLIDRTLYSFIHPDGQESLKRAHLRLVRLDEYQSVTLVVKMLRHGDGVAYVSIHMIKTVTSNEPSLPFSITVLFTILGTEEEPMTSMYQSLPKYRKIENEQDEILGEHSELFYTGYNIPPTDFCSRVPKKRKL